VKWKTTTQALDELMSSEDSLVWNTFCDHFRPVVENFAQQLGLTETDAEDAAQQTMIEFAESFRKGKYKREKGHLSNWLFGIAKRVILNIRSHQPPEHLIADKTTGTSFWDLVQDDKTIEHRWETEWQQMVLERCLEQARQEFDPKVFDAFSLYAISQISVDEVCKQLDMSRNAVYISKSRVLSRLRELRLEFE
jgi:RNA polymerase sigma-70 factor (ECF subfamily)